MTPHAVVPSVIEMRVGELARDDYMAQTVRFNPAMWRTTFTINEALDADVEAMCARFTEPAETLGRVSRQSMCALGSEARGGGASERRQLVIGSFMFGYGRGGRVYGNAKRTLKSDRLGDVLDAVSAALDGRDVAGAYKAFSTPHLPGFDVGFFTKYLYFYSRFDKWPDDVAKPAIFDSFVQSTLSFMRSPLGIDWTGGTKTRGAPNRYRLYCETLMSWSEQLSTNDRKVEPDQIELFLYRSAGADAKRDKAPFIFSSADVLFQVASALADPAQMSETERLKRALDVLPAHLVATLFHGESVEGA